MISSSTPAKLKALGRLETIRRDVQRMHSVLESLTLWQPAAGLRRQTEAVLEMLQGVQDRFERKLVVSLIGPSGSGKSTLLNALAGGREWSVSGHDRPTTRMPLVFCREVEDAEPLLQRFGPDAVETRIIPPAAELSQVLLIDSPDTDSVEMERHRPVLNDLIALSDVLICVFDAENPKRRDHVDFLIPHVQRFHGESLIAVLNKCDRQDETELREKILPEFKYYLSAALALPVQDVLAVSARRHLANPQWDPQATPRHEFDQFDRLHGLVFDEFQRPGYAVNRRLENARQLARYLAEEIRSQVEADREQLVQAVELSAEIQKSALQEALSALKQEQLDRIAGVSVLVYQNLSQKWVGPVGWLIALWGRMLIFGTGFAAVLRFGNPLRQILGVLSALWHYKESKAALHAVNQGEGLSGATRAYRRTLIQKWPAAAEKLVCGGFDAGVRRMDQVLPNEEALEGRLSSAWQDLLHQIIDAKCRRLSGPTLQTLLNLPVLLLMAHAGWITAQRYMTAQYLSSDFFLHAVLTILIVLFLIFFLFQGVVRWTAGPEGILRQALAQIQTEGDRFEPGSASAAVQQVETILELPEIFVDFP